MAPAPTLRLGRQAATCALFCALALAVMAWRHPDDWLADTRTGWALPVQLALAAAWLLMGWGLRGLYIAQTLLAGLALGPVYLHLGLLMAVVLHVLIDWVGLSLMAARSKDLGPTGRP